MSSEAKKQTRIDDDKNIDDIVSSEIIDLVDAFIEEAKELKASSPFAIQALISTEAFHNFKTDKQIEILTCVIWKAAKICLDHGSKQVLYDDFRYNDLDRPYQKVFYALAKLHSVLLTHKLPLTSAHFELYCNILRENECEWCGDLYIPLLSRIEALKIEENYLPESVRFFFEGVKNNLLPAREWAYSDERRTLDRIEKLISSRPGFVLVPNQSWVNAIQEDLDTLDSKQATLWMEFLEFLSSAKGSSPSKKWSKQGSAYIQEIGSAQVKEKTKLWLPFIIAEKITDEPLSSGINSDTIKGFAWTCAHICDDDIITLLGQLAEYCFKKIPYIGPVSEKAGNACVYTLAHSDELFAISQLSILSSKIKYSKTKALIDRNLNKASERMGVSKDDLEELATSDFGFERDGNLTFPIDADHKALLEITENFAFQLSWQAGDKVRKAVPSAIKQEHADTIKVIKAKAKTIEQTIKSARTRLESLFLRKKSWDYETWKERYIDHALMFQLASRLIWVFEMDGEKTIALWYDGDFIRSDTSITVEFNKGTRVSLWHPIDAQTSEIQNWRNLLLEKQIRQPFKQAHREIYILTDAELETNTYSNRFAGHILKQHQFAALSKERSWSYSLQGRFDSWNSCTRHLPEWDFQVEYHVEGIDHECSDLGIFTYVTTDQVRFLSGHTPVALANVPAIVLSEVLRDVDLFVGVSSIGSDPNWQDRGGAPAQFNDYWHDFSFGELNTSAVNRKDILEQIIPSLKIASRCEIKGRFLYVEGDIRRYKIHLGSGNIMMEPNDQYLCIVVGGSTARKPGKIFLPFEGDRVLSIILSKAFMLAEDKKIKDPSIISQIKI